MFLFVGFETHMLTSASQAAQQRFRSATTLLRVACCQV